MRKQVQKLILSLMLAGVPVMSLNAFAVTGVGPGYTNLSPEDEYAIYQWGLKNDGKLSLDFSMIKEESYADIYQSYKEWAGSGKIGTLPRTLEPGDFESSRLKATSGVDMNVAEGFRLYKEEKAAGKLSPRDVVVAVIDTGIDTEHAELRDGLWVNEDELPGDGIDNDGNGYVDDVHGYNFFDQSPVLRDNKRTDLHGTHAAGTISAKWENGGMTGLTDNEHVKLMPLKALDKDGAGTEESIIEAIRYAEANGASICNLSLGGTDYFPELERVIANSSMLFVIACGNGDEHGVGYDTDVRPVYPASYAAENIISVANLDFTGALDRSSNYGAESVDLAAPGTYVMSTAPGNRFTFLSGTSMAAPMVTGVCAMVYSYRPDFGLLKVKEAVLNTAKPYESLKGKVKTGGIPDLYAAMNYER